MLSPDYVCDGCGQLAPSWTLIFLRGEGLSEELCPSCYSQEMADRLGLDHFAPPELKPEVFYDFAGRAHTFHMVGRLFATGYGISAVELHKGKPSGYRFDAMGPLGGSPYQVLGSLRQKIRTGLAYKNLEPDPGEPQLPLGRPVHARIECPADQDGPALIIDGQELGWAELARMVQTYEGFQLRLEIRDRTEDW